MTRRAPASASGARRRLAYLTLATVALVVLVVFGSRLLTPGQATGATSAVPLWALVPVAYIAGVLALLSPCSAAILPAFFAYSFETRGRLARMTYVFYLGLALVFVPLSGASALVNDLVLDHQALVFGIAGGVLILLGLVALFGLDLGRLAAAVGVEPSTVGQQRIAQASTDDGKVYLMGAVFGFTTSSCTAPIIGSLVALSVSAGLTALAGVVLFLVFALGIVSPLFAMALWFETSEIPQRLADTDPWTLEIAGRRREFHPVHVVSGTVLILLGLVFVATRGTLALTRYYTKLGLTGLYEETKLGLQRFFATPLGQAIAGLILVGILSGGAYALWRWRAREAAGG